jgi:hypothetical protein
MAQAHGTDIREYVLFELKVALCTGIDPKFGADSAIKGLGDDNVMMIISIIDASIPETVLLQTTTLVP